MSLLDDIANKFKEWFNGIKNSIVDSQINKLPSDDIEDYFFDPISGNFIQKNKITQFGIQNTLNLLKYNIETINANVESLTAIITYINQINVDTTNLQAIIADINNLDVNLSTIESLTTSIDGNITSLTAIISNINTMNTNISNLQAIIADIANIESLSTSIDGNITSLTAIISNINTMNTNISNLQTIIADIANIESLTNTIQSDTTNLQAIIANISNINTQINALSTAVANIYATIGTINTAIANIETSNASIDVDIGTVKDLDIDISEQVNKSLNYSGTMPYNTNNWIAEIDSDYLFNAVSVELKNDHTENIDVEFIFRDSDGNDIFIFDIVDNDFLYLRDFYFPPNKYIHVLMYNKSTSKSVDYDLKFYYTPTPLHNIYNSKFGLDQNTTRTFYIKDAGLINRLSYVFYHSGASQDYTIKIYGNLYAYSNLYYAKILEENITGSASAILSGTLTFPEVSSLKVEIIENNYDDSYVQINLFFSNSILPELEEHEADTTIHYLQSAIDHVNLLNKGTNTHAQIDSHIADTTIHYLQSAIDHINLLNKGTNTHAQIDSHIADNTIHYLQSAIDHVNLLNKGTNTHAQIDSHIGNNPLHVKRTNIAVVGHTRGSTTYGGTFSSGAWRTRPLNTEIEDAGSLVSVSSNRITVANAGYYKVSVFSQAFRVGRNICCLYDYTGSSILEYGSSEYSNTTYGGSVWSKLCGIYYFTAGRVLEVRHRCETSKTNQGFGIESNIATNLYALVILERVGS